MPSKLLKQAFSTDNLERSWRAIHENARTSKSDEVRGEIARFAEEAPANLRSLQNRLSRGKFTFKPARGIPIPKLDSRGKPTGDFRPIVLAPVESRLVQRCLLNVLVGVPAIQPFLRTPFSFGGLRKSEKQTGPKDGDRLTAVPAAIAAALHEIGRGANYVATADIQAFFTCIPKSEALKVISGAVHDEVFEEFLERAIAVELENLSDLRSKAGAFPIEDIGIAQGNSLSPLLGNIILADFDRIMNEGDCTCLRYIDDLLILGPSRKAVAARVKKAVALLAQMGMRLSPEKSSTAAAPVVQGFEFLGIQICPGLIRPAKKAQRKLIERVDNILREGKRALVSFREGRGLEQDMSLIRLLRRVEGVVSGWGKHYWFCNDRQVFSNLDQAIWSRVKDYLGCYTDIRSVLPQDKIPLALGLTQLRLLSKDPFLYPNQSLNRIHK